MSDVKKPRPGFREFEDSGNEISAHRFQGRGYVPFLSFGFVSFISEHAGNASGGFRTF